MKKTMLVLGGIAIALVVVCVVVGAIVTAVSTGPKHDPKKLPAAASSPSSPVATSPPVAASSAPAPASPAAPKKATIADGTYTVGEDIPPGTYKVKGASDTCYWAIYQSGKNQAPESIINNKLGGGNLTVTLKAGQDFETNRCGTWSQQ